MTTQTAGKSLSQRGVELNHRGVQYSHPERRTRAMLRRKNHVAYGVVSASVIAHPMVQ